MRRTRRLLSILLVTVMLTALMPVTAHAAFEDQPCKECGHTDWELLDVIFTTCTEPAERLWRCATATVTRPSTSRCWDTITKKSPSCAKRFCQIVS